MRRGEDEVIAACTKPFGRSGKVHKVHSSPVSTVASTETPQKYLDQRQGFEGVRALLTEAH